MNPSLILSKLGISPSLSQDIILVLVIALISFIFGMIIGRHKLVTVLINIYVSVAILSVFPENYLTSYTQKLFLFLALIVVLTLSGKKLFEIYISGSGTGFLWRVFVMSFLEVILLLSIILSMIPKKVALEYVSSSSYSYLAGENFQLIWMVLPLVFMLFIHRKLSR